MYENLVFRLNLVFLLIASNCWAIPTNPALTFRSLDLQQERAVVDISAICSPTGVWYDGHYFWITCGTNIKQLWIDKTETAHQVYNISLSGMSFTPSGITGVDEYLYLSGTETICNPACANYSRIWQMDKEGNRVKRITNAVGGAVTGPRDVAMNDQYIAFGRTDSSIPVSHVIKVYDRGSRRQVYNFSVGRSAIGLAYTGEGLLAILGGIGVLMTHEGVNRFIKSGLGTGVTGMAFGDTTMHPQDGVPKFMRGEWVVISYA